MRPPRSVSNSLAPAGWASDQTGLWARSFRGRSRPCALLSRLPTDPHAFPLPGDPFNCFFPGNGCRCPYRFWLFRWFSDSPTSAPIRVSPASLGEALPPPPSLRTPPSALSFRRAGKHLGHRLHSPEGTEVPPRCSEDVCITLFSKMSVSVSLISSLRDIRQPFKISNSRAYGRRSRFIPFSQISVLGVQRR